MASVEVSGSAPERQARSAAPTSTNAPYLRRGSVAFRRANLAMFLAGCGIFSILYCTQPVLPDLSRQFALSPVMASLSISLPTAGMAIAMLVMSTLSEVWGRTRLMIISLFAAALFQLLVPASPNYTVLLVLRTLEGIALSGVPSTILAYLAEETDKDSYGLAVGLYISGTTIGGMSGRFLVGALTDAYSWRVALLAIGVLAALLGLAFMWLLPPSRHFQPRPFEPRALALSLVARLRDPGLLLLYAVGCLTMGSFVTVYNYISFRLVAAPYHLSQTVVGGVFLIYLVGTFSSTWMGRLADRIGRRQTLWMGPALMLVGLAVTLFMPLALALLGVSIFTFGFFASHSIATSWVGKRAFAGKAQASALYFFFYYTGSSVVGATGGFAWSMYQWSGVVAMLSALVALALGVTILLRRIKPVAPAEAFPA
ncbi:MAG TPA: MFS transporter [Ktedonobacterales bacterium]|nr:MFS transporter [Ktedonobacterales bacterium]